MNNIYTKIEKQLDEDCIDYYKKLNIIKIENKNLDEKYPEYAKIYYILRYQKIIDEDINKILNNDFYQYYKIKNMFNSNIKYLKNQINNYKKEKLNSIFEWFNF